LSAEIRIGENSKIVSTNPANGAYHRMLLPGTYSVTASASGYISQTHEVTVLDPLASVQNFSLDEAQVISFQGSIRDAEGYPISGASVIIEADPEISLLADVNGIFTIPALYEGDYQVRIASAGLGIFNKLVSFRNGDSYKTFVLLPPLFEDEFENGLEAWTIQSPWAIINQEGNNMLTDSPSGNYSNNANRSARITTPVNLSGISSPPLCFKTRYDLESGYDFVHVEASLNGTTWTNLTSFTGEQDSWAQQSLSLANYSGLNVYIRFRLRSDSNISDDGIYLDDVLISGTSGNITIFGDVSRDQILAEDDAQAILDYSIGLDPIPQVDALPWEPGTIQAAEVSGDENVNSLDAWLVHRFLLDTGFRFPVQSGEAIELQIPELESSVEDNRLRLFFSPQVELKAFNLSFANDPGFQIGEIVWGPNSLNGMRAQNLSGENRTLAYLSRGEQFDYVDIFYTASSSALSAEIIINGELRIYELSLKTSAQDSIGPAFAFSLLQNYPNPFNPSTLIKYSVPESRGATRLQIFNHKGQLVRTLIDETQAAGTYTATFDGLDDRGSKLGSGIYFYRLSLGTQSTTRKMILLK
ncbi:MAG: FlgD immunoglobulin-like domain containing protein, partial [Candidatus Cloacimonetes bacterium]|nr:FlgD immunoglobulin-like domain containing protein [Candidatus Cloacimonadota bacterium]